MATRGHVCCDLDTPEQKTAAKELAKRSNMLLSDWLRAVCLDAITKKIIVRKIYVEVSSGQLTGA